MNELIEYFKKIEARLAALELAQQAKPEQDNSALQQALEAVSEQVSALMTTLSNLQEQVASYQEAQAELESRMDELESRAEFDLPDDDSFEEDEPESPEEEEDENEDAQEDDEPLLPIAEEEPESPEVPAEPEPEPVPHSVVPKVTDIKKAISLGDRFLFQRELFGGNGELMAKTIADLNKLNSLDEAEAYIEKRFSWDKESSAYELFFNILKRRW